jgi:hypothetical protein
VAGYAATASIRFLADVIDEFNVTTLADVPCGDVNWQFESWEMDSLQLYLGLDVAAKVIAMDQQRFEHHRNKAFAVWDFSACAIPQYVTTTPTSCRTPASQPQPFELVHVRDVIQHMPIDKGVDAVRNVFESGCTWAVMTTMPTTPEGNARGKTMQHSSYYGAQLGSPPFDEIVPKPIRCIETHPHHEKDLTCLYRCKDAPLKRV